MPQQKTKSYSSIIQEIFRSKFRKGAQTVDFEREDIVRYAKKLGVGLPKNLGDLVYSYRYRAVLPAAIQSKAGRGQTWIIRSRGTSKYSFALVPDKPLAPNKGISATKVPDSTPGVVAKYALSDEQALLAKVRYNRLLDIFTGVACYSLQNHLRTSVPSLGQVETDELYVGVDKRGIHYVFPVQAKGHSDKLGRIQIEQDFAICSHKFPSLVCRPIAIQFVQEDVIAMLEFEQDERGAVGIASEKHYKLVPAGEVTEHDLSAYRSRTS